jgi:hypothetical protein
MRLLAAKVQKGQRDYKTAKSALPQQARQVKAAILAALKSHVRAVRAAKSIEDLNKLASVEIVNYRIRNQWPPEPRLRVCDAKHYLEMFQRDSREVIPVNSNSELWRMLQSPCEVK